MNMDIREEPHTDLEQYALVPISFEVRSLLELFVRNDGLGGLRLIERSLSPTWVKDYDAIPGNHPTDWPQRFDISNWGLLSARIDGERVGGAAIAFRTPDLVMLEQRKELAILWDLRVAPDARRRGLGAALFNAASHWAMTRGCRWFKVETQNVNVPACRFYASQGCTLGGIQRFAYTELPDEIQLLWYKELAAG
jgi:GNAT superfamily N-acetyltransferase